MKALLLLVALLFMTTSLGALTLYLLIQLNGLGIMISTACIISLLLLVLIKKALDERI